MYSLFGLILLFTIPIFAFDKKCNLNLTAIEAEKPFALISFFPENPEGYLIKSRSVVIFTCKNNTRRYKHYCGSNGKWDMIPGMISYSGMSQMNVIFHPWTWKGGLSKDLYYFMGLK